MAKLLTLDLYPVDANEYIANMYVDYDGSTNKVETFVILDVSMKDVADDFIRKILPMVMSHLYLDEINLITSSSKASRASIYKRTKSELQTNTVIKAAGRTYLNKAIKMLHDNIRQLDSSTPIRVLTISDGAIYDTTGDEENDLVEYLEHDRQDCCMINSQAVRLVTSDNQPDTKALSNLMQINTTISSTLLDIDAKSSKKKIARQIAALFKQDNFSKCQMLRLNQRIILGSPRCSALSFRTPIVPGWCLFFVRLTGAIPIEGSVGNRHIKAIMHNRVDLATFQDIMANILPHIVDQMKILKVVGTTQANQSVNRIVTFFQRKEESLAQGASFDASTKISNFLSRIAQNSSNLSDSKAMAKFLQSNDELVLVENLWKQMEKQKVIEAKRKREAVDAAIRKMEAEDAAKLKREAEDEAKRIKEADHACNIADKQTEISIELDYEEGPQKQNRSSYCHTFCKCLTCCISSRHFFFGFATFMLIATLLLLHFISG